MTTNTPEPRGMRTFVSIWLGQLVSIIGSGLTNFALGVWIFERTGQATPFALTILFGNLPRILLAPVAGALADRWDRRRLMLLADTGSGLVTLVAALFLFNGALDIWHVYLLATCNAICAAFQEPAYTASVSLLVPKKDLPRAAGLMQMSQAIEMLVAPILAGVLFTLIGLSGIMIIDFVTYLVGVGVLLLVRIPQPDVARQESARAGTLLDDVRFGWRYLRDRDGLFWLLVYFALVNFLFNFAAVLTGPLVLSFGAAGVLGIVQMVSGVGMLIGSVVMSAWGGPRRRTHGVIGFIALASLGLLVAGLYPSAIFVGAGLFILTFCVPLASGPSQAIFQTKVDPAVQGRVFAMRNMISRAMMPLAFLLAGPLADYLFEPWMREGGALARTAIGALMGAGPGRGIALLFILSGLLLLGASALAFANRHIRLVEDDLPDALPDPLSPAPGGASANGEPQPALTSS